LEKLKEKIQSEATRRKYGRGIKSTEKASKRKKTTQEGE
jgi:hypothetical protein